MDPLAQSQYGAPSPAEIAGKSGRQILQAIIDGRLPRPPISQTLSFWIAEVGDGFAVFEGEPGWSALNPADAGRIRAGARVAQGRQIISAEARVLSGEGKAPAHGTSTLMVLAPR